MKCSWLWIAVFTLFLSTMSNGQIAINEIRASNGHIEIKNTGSTTTDIGSWWLCRFPDYRQLSTLTLVCGSDLNLEAGAIATVDLNFTVFADDDELGLYINSDFGNPSSIRDYVEWGSHGHTRSSVAEAAGIWANGDFVPDWSDCVSLEYDGSGDASGNWESQDAATMPCLENTLDGCGLMPMEILAFETMPLNDGAMIHWMAIHDPTVSSIYLEHSIDQRNWIEMYTWYPVGPDFDSGDYFHMNLIAGKHFYRLQIRYVDGSFENSELRVLDMCFDNTVVTIWPNPIRDIANIYIQTLEPVENLEYQILNAHGIVVQWVEGPSLLEFDVSQLEDGIYYLFVPRYGLTRRWIKL